MSRVRYLLRRTVHEGPAAARGLLYLGACTAALVSFAVLMPALEYQHVRATQVAAWDVWVSGPLSEEDLGRLAEVPGVVAVARGLSLDLDTVTGPDGPTGYANGAGSVTAIAYRTADELALGAYPEALLVEGSPPGEGEVACDWNTARRFDLSVGDLVTVGASPLGRDIEYRGRLAGVYGPSGPLRDSLVFPATEDVRAAIVDGGGAPWTDAFVSTTDPDALVRAATEGTGGERRVVLERDALRREAGSRLSQEVGPFLRDAATWVAVVGFTALALWQQSTRLERRRREYAILAALGMERRRLVVLDLAEQAGRLGLAAGLGVVAAIALVQEVNGLYVPPGARFGAGAAVAVTLLLTLVVGAAGAGRRLAPSGLAGVLAREGVG